ncbi:helix-turn-helix domain-containing protein [Paraburkholderia sediminicola]|uniref:helix-turn-helix domain-containing protein n=1 Tax=Paraburkholderia sediminicola TaxID=458836 RepID=UPI0038B81F6D
MSHHLTNLTWRIELRGMQKLVLLALSHLAVQSTGDANSTVQRLAFMCGISDSGVREQLKHLTKAGYVEDVLVDGKSIYRVCVAASGATA